MKEKPETVQAEKRTLHRSTNLFLNISIFILSILILFLGYSLLSKLNVFGENSEIDKLVKHKKNMQIEVLNGCGVDGIADMFTDSLRKKNFDVVNTGNYRTFKIDNSIVIDRTGNIINAEYLAEVIGIDKKQVIDQKNKNYFLDVTLIIGKDYKQLFQNN
ncbi:MAG: LytR C-terminal domain-containing protein [Bacteroidetes bacterium]|nr:LytR C-terminal domain-containing protein [Bacteroidota bacterium]